MTFTHFVVLAFTLALTASATEESNSALRMIYAIGEGRTVEPASFIIDKMSLNKSVSEFDVYFQIRVWGDGVHTCVSLVVTRGRPATHDPKKIPVEELVARRPHEPEIGQIVPERVIWQIRDGNLIHREWEAGFSNRTRAGGDVPTSTRVALSKRELEQSFLIVTLRLAGRLETVDFEIDMTDFDWSPSRGRRLVK